MTDQWNCPTCGAAVSPGAHFCAACGNAMPAQAAPLQCARCGAQLRPGMAFCAACGASTVQNAQPAPAQAGTAVCASCGSALAPAAKFCRICGAPQGGQSPGWQQWRPAPAAPAKKQSGAIWIVAGALVVAVVAVAAFLLLSGDDDGGAPAGSGAKAPSRTVTTTSGQVLTATEVELGDMISGLADKTFKVTYEVKGKDAVSGTTVNAQLTIVSAPPRLAVHFDAGSKGLDLSKMAGDGEDGGFTSEGGVMQTLSLIIDEDGSSIICSKMVGEDGQCERSVADPEDEPASVDTALNDVVSSGSEDEAMETVEVKGQKIAGREARCFELRRKEDTGEGKSDVKALFCVDKQEGIPLLFEGKGTSEGAINAGEVLGEDSVDTGGLPEKTAIEGTIKAKSVAFKASDSDFKPPYAVGVRVQ